MLRAERREFWGTSGPSLSACIGLITCAGGAWLWLTSPSGIALGAVGLILIAGAIVVNLRKGFGVKWRKLNVMLHAGMFVLGIALLVLANLIRPHLGILAAL